MSLSEGDVYYFTQTSVAASFRGHTFFIYLKNIIPANLFLGMRTFAVLINKDVVASSAPDICGTEVPGSNLASLIMVLGRCRIIV